MAKKSDKVVTTQKTGVSLSDAISVLRAELIKAKGERSDGDPLLLVEEAEIVLSLGLSYEGKAGGKVNWWVYEAGVEGTRTSERTHTLRVKFKPRTATGGDFELADQ